MRLDKREVEKVKNWMISAMMSALESKYHFNSKETEEYGYYDGEGMWMNPMQMIDRISFLDRVPDNEYKFIEETRKFIERLPNNHKLFKYEYFAEIIDPEPYNFLPRSQNQSWKMLIHYALKKEEKSTPKQVVKRFLQFLIKKHQ